MRVNHMYVLLGLFAVVHTMPVDASGSDLLNMRSVKENVNGVNGNSGANGAHSNSGTNGAHSNSGTNGAHSNPEINGAHSDLEQSTDSDDDHGMTITFLDPAAGTRTVAEGENSIPNRVVRRISGRLRSVLRPWPRGDGFNFTNDYILSDLEAEFKIKVTADGRTEEYTIPRDPDPPHP
ncbi:hypothetical protein DFJ43DRAFT_601305 [Lentinula guzmanii]|uniref:Uncharacterized protein n=1 Tax=Lentinula guzmanii TaxID=2804957 RepID=A0AA38JVC8_9AGAR|nr:hypothetical protein DFJ43DRAFT_601305 [Lentinula guzmanii]